MEKNIINLLKTLKSSLCEGEHVVYGFGKPFENIDPNKIEILNDSQFEIYKYIRRISDKTIYALHGEGPRRFNREDGLCGSYEIQEGGDEEVTFLGLGKYKGNHILMMMELLSKLQIKGVFLNGFLPLRK